MLIVAGTITIDPADVDALRAAASTMMEETHKEPGCHEYIFSISVADPGVVTIFEVWESAAHLEAHFEVPHMATFRQAMSTMTVTGRNLHRYEVASFEPM